MLVPLRQLRNRGSKSTALSINLLDSLGSNSKKTYLAVIKLSVRDR